MGFNCGILGLPNVGKSTLFNALTSTQSAESQNYPFCTIEPNIGKVSVKDARLDKISKISRSKKIVYNQLEFVDIAGLVKGASKGEGLGNKFLDNLKNVDAIIHLVRCFNDKKITHVSNEINPVEDIKIIETELLLSDLNKVDRITNNLLQKNKGKKIDDKIISTLRYIKETLSNGEMLIDVLMSEDQKNIIAEYKFLTSKPYLFVCNIDEESIIKGNELTEEVSKYLKIKKKDNLFISASIESEIAQIKDETERQEFLETIGLSDSGLLKLIKKGYKLLDLITFFTSGVSESRAWSCSANSLAPDAAGRIHTDFKKGFIKAETISYNDFIEFNGELGCKESGKIRQEGKDYIVKEGDIINFKFNV